MDIYPGELARPVHAYSPVQYTALMCNPEGVMLIMFV